MKKISLHVFTFLFALLAISCTKNIAQNPEFDQLLQEGWTINSSAKVNETGDKISIAGFDISSWYKTSVPATPMAALLANNMYPDIFMGDNISKVDTAQFRVSWWYRKEFVIDDISKSFDLIFEGINYRANIWLNGSKIASADTIYGGFRIFKFNVSKKIIKGNNTLAVEIFHQKPDEPSVGFCDWSPLPPDREMGLWRPVKLRVSGKVSLDNIFIASKLEKPGYKKAELTVSALAINNSASKIEAIVKGKIENISIEKKVVLNPNEKQLVVFTPTEFSQLKIENPRLWWPHDLGKPKMYNLKMEIITDNEVSYSKNTRFGVREVEDYFNERGHRGYKINGIELLIKGGGWVDGMFLNDTEEKVRTQIEYVKHANMNTIRLEGFWGNSERLYELADEMGVLIMVGWSCQWEWECYLAKPEDEFMSLKTPEDIALIINYTRDHVNWLRNHPSIFVWVLGSDKLPRPELEKKYHELFAQIDTTRPLLMACKIHTSIISGPTGVKMYGPYDYVAPNYWYLDSTAGGAFGFNSETGPGPQVPSLEIVKTMIPEDKLWPINEIWAFHCGRLEFKTLGRYTKAFDKRYGEQSNVEDFTFKSQASNLEAMRAMYEAFAVNRKNTTGIIQWMFNSAWPKLIWQLWDYNLVPNAAYYGAKIGARPLNIIYNYGNHSIYIANLSPNNADNLLAEIKILDFNSQLIDEMKINAAVKGNSSQKIYALPNNNKLTKLYFVSLKLKDKNGKTVCDNFYWLSTAKDVNDFKNTTWINTPLSEYADFTDLNKLPKVSPEINSNLKSSNGNYEVKVNLNNTDNKVAFMIELKITGAKSGKSIVPVIWDDNYISLLPGESREIKATFPEEALHGEKPVFKFNGWNLK